jgi:hypothetical protein
MSSTTNAGRPELVIRDRRELQRVLEQARPCGKSCPWQRVHARIFLLDAGHDPRIVAPGGLRHHEELVARGELDVAIRVAEEFGEFCLDRPQRYDAGRDPAENRRGLLLRRRRRSADDLRHSLDLVDGQALDDALRTERHRRVEPAAGQQLLNPIGRARCDRRAQDEELRVLHVRQKLLDAAGHGIPTRILKLVDRRANRDDQSIGRGDVRPGRRSEELSRGERLLQLRLTSLLDEGKSPRHEGPDAVGVEVIDQRPKAAVGEDNGEWRTDVPGAPDDANVVALIGHGYLHTHNVRS